MNHMPQPQLIIHNHNKMEEKHLVIYGPEQ